jgi:hypothetical protein
VEGERDRVTGYINSKTGVFHIWASTGERSDALRGTSFVGSSLMQVLRQMRKCTSRPEQFSCRVVNKFSRVLHEFEMKRSLHSVARPHLSLGMHWRYVVAPGD